MYGPDLVAVARFSFEEADVEMVESNAFGVVFLDEWSMRWSEGLARFGFSFRFEREKMDRHKAEAD